MFYRAIQAVEYLLIISNCTATGYQLVEQALRAFFYCGLPCVVSAASAPADNHAVAHQPEMGSTPSCFCTVLRCVCVCVCMCVRDWVVGKYACNCHKVAALSLSKLQSLHCPLSSASASATASAETLPICGPAACQSARRILDLPIIN